MLNTSRISKLLVMMTVGLLGSSPLSAMGSVYAAPAFKADNTAKVQDLEFIPGEFVAKQKLNLSSRSLSSSFSRLGLQVKKDLGKGVFALKDTKLDGQMSKPRPAPRSIGANKDDAFSLKAALRRAQEIKASGLFSVVEPNYVYRLNARTATFAPSLVRPNDEYFRQQWALDNLGKGEGTVGADIDALKGWNLPYPHPQLRKPLIQPVVAILDTGVDYNHEDLKEKILRENGQIVGYDFASSDADPMDDSGHGTHMAGLIAAKHNTIGTAGVCMNCVIMPIKVFDQRYMATLDIAIQGLDFAVAHGAQIINNSWSGPGYSKLLEDKFRELYDLGIISVASVGNSNTDRLYYPAAYKGVFSVAATNNQDKDASYSNYGDYVDVSAPGGEVNPNNINCNDTRVMGPGSSGFYWDNAKFDCRTVSSSGAKYLSLEGTSSSTALVTGLVGEIYSGETSPSLKGILERVARGAEDITAKLSATKKDKFGIGRVNMDRSLNGGGAIGSYYKLLSAYAADANGAAAVSELSNNVSYGVNVWWKNSFGTPQNDVISLEENDPSNCVVANMGNTVSGVEGWMIYNWKKAVTLNVGNCPARYNYSVNIKLTSEFGIVRSVQFSTVINRVLPGWPQSVGNLLTSIGTPFLNQNDSSETAVADINGDGKKEIIRAGDKLYVFNANGTAKAGWPQSFATAGQNTWVSGLTPVVGNIDGDPGLEIVVPEYMMFEDGTAFTLKLNAWNADGTRVAGFDYTTSSRYIGQVALADTNNDGIDEVFFASMVFATGDPFPAYKETDIKLHAISKNGNGYSLATHEFATTQIVTTAASTVVGPSPVVANLDGQSGPEVYFSSSETQVAQNPFSHLHRVTLASPTSLAVTSRDVAGVARVSEIKLRDLDGVGGPELILGGEVVLEYPGGMIVDPVISIYNFATMWSGNSQPLDGWPKAEYRFALGNFDNNPATIEIASTTWDTLTPESIPEQFVGYYKLDGQWVKGVPAGHSFTQSTFPTVFNFNGGNWDELFLGDQVGGKINAYRIANQKFESIFSVDALPLGTQPDVVGFDSLSKIQVVDINDDGKYEMITTFDLDKVYVIPIQ